jgi:hypothetical protein
MFGFIGFITLYPLLGKKNKNNDKIHKSTLKSVLKKYKPSKLELFMTKNFGSESTYKSKWKLGFVLTQVSLLLIGFASIIISDMFPRSDIHWYMLTISTYTFVILLTLLAVLYSTAKVLKTIRFKKISDDLGYSINQINQWVDFHDIKEKDIL